MMAAIGAVLYSVVVVSACGSSPQSDETCTSTDPWYTDTDGDGWGNAEDLELPCTEGAVETPGDCDDTNPDVHPDAEEVCANGVDDNCDDKAQPCAFEGKIEVLTADLRIRSDTADGRMGWTPDPLQGAVTTSGLQLLIPVPMATDGSPPGMIVVVDGSQSGDVSTTDPMATIYAPASTGGLGYSLEWLSESSSLPHGAMLATAPNPWSPGYGIDGSSYLIEGPLSGTIQLELDDSLFPVHQGGELASLVGGSTSDGVVEVAFSGGERIAIHEVGSLGSVDYDDARVLIEPYFDGSSWLSAEGDLDGDGLSEVIAAFAPSTDRGRIEVFDISTDGSYGYEDAILSIVGPCPGDGFGSSVDASQDLDLDGTPDIAVSRSGTGCSDTTDAYLFDGLERGAVTMEQAIAQIDDIEYYRSGFALQQTADVTGDGRADLLMSTGIHGASASDSLTAVHLFAGPLEGSLTTLDAQATFLSDTHAGGWSTPGTIPDRNGDGMPEIVIGTSDSTLNDPDAGAIFIFDSIGW